MGSLATVYTRSRSAAAIALLMLLAAVPSQAVVVVDWAPVEAPGNAADASVMEDGTSGYGSVAYVYRIGRFEVTNAEYAELLNAVAATDTHDLYDTRMGALLSAESSAAAAQAATRTKRSPAARACRSTM